MLSCVMQTWYDRSSRRNRKKGMNKRLEIGRYLICLEEDGWSKLIDSRWKDEIKETLLAKFPDMTNEEWIQISSVVFW